MAQQRQTSRSQADLKREADKLYAAYGRPLEETHRGEYLAISKDGRTLLAPTLEDALDQAVETFGPDNFIFKVGERAVGKWLWLPAA